MLRCCTTRFIFLVFATVHGIVPPAVISPVAASTRPALRFGEPRPAASAVASEITSALERVPALNEPPTSLTQHARSIKSQSDVFPPLSTSTAVVSNPSLRSGARAWRNEQIAPASHVDGLRVSLGAALLVALTAAVWISRWWRPSAPTTEQATELTEQSKFSVAAFAGSFTSGLAAVGRRGEESRIALFAAKKGKKLEELSVGDKVDARVTRIAKIGVWLDVGAEKEALWPKNQAGPGMDQYKPGDVIKGMTIFELQTGKTPPERKIRVSMKEMTEKIEVGKVVDGTVLRATQFGVFFDIGAPSDVLGPNNLLSKPPDEYEADEKVKLKIAKIDGGRITVTTDLEAEDGPGATLSSLKVGQEVSGTVMSIAPNIGLFLNVGVERDALYRTSQLDKPVEQYTNGEVLTGLRISSVNVAKGQIEVTSRRLPSEVQEGEELTGVVLMVNNKIGIFFDAGLSTDVLAPMRNLSKAAEEYTQGEVADLKVVKVDGDRITVSTMVDASPIAEVIRGTVVTGTVVSIQNTGLFLNIGAARDALWRASFLPKPLTDYKEGDEISGLMVTAVDTTRNTIEVNSPEALQKMSESKADGSGPQALTSFPVGTQVVGEVKRVTPFGIFLDVGAERDALYPANQVSGDLESYKPGDKISDIRITMNDPVQMRLAVSSKKTAADFEVGDSVVGSVTKVMAFGVFVDIGASTEALLPTRLLAKPSNEYKVGSTLEGLTITQLDVGENKISIGEVAGEGGADSGTGIGSLKVGQKIKGKVRGVQDFGIFMDIGLARQDALLPMSMLGEGVSRDDFQTGKEFEVFIAAVDVLNNRITVSMTEPSGQAKSTAFIADGIPPGDMIPDPLFVREYTDGRMLPGVFQGMDTLMPPFGEQGEDAGEAPDIVEIGNRPKGGGRAGGGGTYSEGMNVWQPKSESENNPALWLFAMHGNGWNSAVETMGKHPMHKIPVPFHLRKVDAEVPGPADSPLSPEELEDEQRGGWDTGLPPHIHEKYRQQPLNDPNFVEFPERELAKAK